MNKAFYEKKLNELRSEWKAKPEMRDIIERQARALKRGMEAGGRKVDDIIDEARKIFNADG